MTTQEIPYGYCHCGCGEKTNLAPRTDARKGWVSGEPMRFVARHHKRLRTPIEERFWSKVDKQGQNDCWNWTDWLDRDGYGQIGTGGKYGKTLKAHRYSYQLHYGVDPGELMVMHRCDNPSCVNPKHLELGTNADNVRDCWDKGRANPPTPMQGASHPLSSITPKLAQNIRKAYRTKDITQDELAVDFNVSKGSIYYILKGKHWTVKGQPDLVAILHRDTRRWRISKSLCQSTP